MTPAEKFQVALLFGVLGAFLIGLITYAILAQRESDKKIDEALRKLAELSKPSGNGWPGR